MPPDAASIARFAKQRRQYGGREGCPKADADAALKARPGRVIHAKDNATRRQASCTARNLVVTFTCLVSIQRENVFRCIAPSLPSLRPMNESANCSIDWPPIFANWLMVSNA